MRTPPIYIVFYKWREFQPQAQPIKIRSDKLNWKSFQVESRFHSIGDRNDKNSVWYDRLLMIQVWKFIRRLFYFKQMDFQYALWQAHKLLVNPQQLYKGFQYRFVLLSFMDHWYQVIIIRKTTKGQFARDDPAFLVLLASTFAITTLSFGIMNGFPILKMLYLLLWFVCVDCVGLGILERAWKEFTWITWCWKKYIETQKSQAPKRPQVYFGTCAINFCWLILEVMGTTSNGVSASERICTW